MNRKTKKNADFWSEKHGTYLVLPDDGLEVSNPDTEQIILAMFAPVYCPKYNTICCLIVRKGVPDVLFFEKISVLALTH